jgi:hypothetical protein
MLFCFWGMKSVGNQVRKILRTNTASCLDVAQIFQLNRITDLSAGAPEPCQKGVAGFVEGVHFLCACFVSGGGLKSDRMDMNIVSEPRAWR